jgi:hypothetical protein
MKESEAPATIDPSLLSTKTTKSLYCSGPVLLHTALEQLRTLQENPFLKLLARKTTHFPKFVKLPIELQRMIWTLALDNGLAISEAVYNIRLGQLISGGPLGHVQPLNLQRIIFCPVLLISWLPRWIFDVCKVRNRLPDMRPIFLPPVPQLRHCRCFEMWSHLTLPIYIRSEKDILYISSINILDIDAFTSTEKNRCIQHLAISSTA